MTMRIAPGARSKIVGITKTPDCRNRFLALDEMRGVAALFVVWGHYGSYDKTFAPHFYYLAVDLFFLLSGFVLAYANDLRFEAGQSGGSFMVDRLCRLAPLYLIGLFLGSLSLLLIHRMGPQSAVTCVAINFFGLPSPVTDHAGLLFPPNIVFWSLFFELWIGNLLYAVFWRWLRPASLALLIGASGVGLMACLIVWHHIDVGWTWKTIAGGFFRVGYSFFGGIGLARLHRLRPPRLCVPSWLPAMVLALVLACPLHGLAGHFFEVWAAFVIFPALIRWGAEAGERFHWMSKVLGDTSYAVYTVHLPIIAVLAHSWLHGAMKNPMIEVSLIVAIVMFAYALERWVDRPLQRRLRKRRAAVRALAA